MPFETKLTESQNRPTYNKEGENAPPALALTPAGDANRQGAVPPSCRSAVYSGHPLWDGGHASQWHYYNPSSDYYGSHPRYYPFPPRDPYYPRDYHHYVPAPGYLHLQYPYSHHPSAPPDNIARTPTMNVHLTAVGHPSIQDHHTQDQHSRSPQRYKMDPTASMIQGADPAVPKSSKSFDSNGIDDAWKRQGQNHPYEEQSMAEIIEPAPLVSSGNEYHYGNPYSSSSTEKYYPPAPPQQHIMGDYVPHSSSSSSSTTKRSLAYAETMPHYPFTPYHEMTDSKSRFEPQSKKMFVTPDHMSPYSSPPRNGVSSSVVVHGHHPFPGGHDDEIHASIRIPSPTSSIRSERYESAKKKTIIINSGGSGTKQKSSDRKQLQSKAWFDRFNDLKEYKEKHGNCLVPQKYPPNPSLGIWVNKQRMEYKLLQDNEKSSMSEDRLAALHSIGFVWAKRKGQATWDTKFKQLLEYRAIHGDCLIPTKYAKNPALGRWVSTQREQYRMWKAGHPKSKMTPEKARMLDDIGFVWRLQF